MAIKTFIVSQDHIKSIDLIETRNKDNVRVTLSIKRAANDNQYEIHSLKKEVEKHSLKLTTNNSRLDGMWQFYLR